MIKRMHVAVNCSDLHKSLDFYRAFFGAEPMKVKDNYAKFELESPALSRWMPHYAVHHRPHL